MNRLIIPALIAVLVCGPAWGADRDGNYTIVNPPSCGEYLYAYSRSTLTPALRLLPLYAQPQYVHRAA
jgi:hypothetical protein